MLWEIVIAIISFIIGFFVGGYMIFSDLSRVISAIELDYFSYREICKETIKMLNKSKKEVN